MFANFITLFFYVELTFARRRRWHSKDISLNNLDNEKRQELINEWFFCVLNKLCKIFLKSKMSRFVTKLSHHLISFILLHTQASPTLPAPVFYKPIQSLWMVVLLLPPRSFIIWSDFILKHLGAWLILHSLAPMTSI